MSLHRLDDRRIKGLGFANDLIVPEERDEDSLGQQDVVDDIGAESKEAAAPVEEIDPNKLDFKNKPLNSFLRVLANIGAGLQGKKLPSDILIKQNQENQLVAAERMKTGLALYKSLVEKGGPIDKAPEDQKKSVAEAHSARLREIGFGPTADAVMLSLDDKKTTDDIAEFLGAEPDRILAMAGGDLDKAVELAQNKEVQKIVNESADIENIPIVISKLKFMVDIVERSGVELPPEAFDLDGNFKISNFAELRLASQALAIKNKSAEITPSEMGTLKRNPHLAQAFGIATPDLQKTKAEASPTIKIIEEGDKKFAIGIDPNTGEQKFKTPLGDLEKNVNVSEVKLGAQLIASGNDIPDSFSDETKSIVGGMSQEEAATFLKTGQAKGISIKTVTDSEGNSVQKITFGSVDDDDIEEKLKDKEIGVRNLSREITNAITMVDNNRNITTTLGAGFSRLIGALEANVKSIIDTGGIDISALSGGLDASKYGKEVFGDLAGKSAAFRTLTFNLAVMAAAAKGTKGKALSDKDLELELRALGSNADDPDQVIASMRETRRLAIENFKTEFRVRTDGREFTGLDELLKTGNKFTAMTDEEINALLKDTEALQKLTSKERKMLRDARDERKK